MAKNVTFHLFETRKSMVPVIFMSICIPYLYLMMEYSPQNGFNCMSFGSIDAHSQKRYLICNAGKQNGIVFPSGAIYNVPKAKSKLEWQTLAIELNDNSVTGTTFLIIIHTVIICSCNIVHNNGKLCMAHLVCTFLANQRKTGGRIKQMFVGSRFGRIWETVGSKFNPFQSTYSQFPNWRNYIE